MEVTVSSDLPEGLSEAFRMRAHRRSACVIIQVQTVTVTEQIGALIRLYAFYLHTVLLQDSMPPPTTSLLSTDLHHAHKRPEHAFTYLQECRQKTLVLWSHLNC